MARSGRALRVMIYDATWHGSKPDQWFLTTSWILGGLLYRVLGRIDATYGATSWADAIAWLRAITEAEGEDIRELQYWGHGKWGRVLIGTDRFDARCLDDDSHPMHGEFVSLRARFTPSSLIWFRTCMTFGTEVGQRFASSCMRFFGCRVAGHTYVVGPLQSGLHSLSPGESAGEKWSPLEGVARGDEKRSTWTRLYDAWLSTRSRVLAEKKKPATAAPEGREPSGLMSSKRAPNTITCLHGAVPDGW